MNEHQAIASKQYRQMGKVHLISGLASIMLSLYYPALITGTTPSALVSLLHLVAPVAFVSGIFLCARGQWMLWKYWKSLDAQQPED